MPSGYGDAARLKDALELARSFKSSGKQDTYGGVKKSKKKNSSAQPFKHQAPPPASARGVPNVSMRNYPSAGSFVARESNNKPKGPPVMSAALDFLNRQDKPVNPPASKMETKPPMAQPPSSHTQPSTQVPQVPGKQNIQHKMQGGTHEARAKQLEPEPRLEKERKDRIAEKLEALSLSKPKPVPVQPTIQPAPSAQHPLKPPQAAVQPTASTPQRDIQTPSQASAVSSPSTGHSGSAQPPMVKTGTGSRDANIWGNFLKFAPRGLVSATSEAKASPSKSQSPDSARAAPVQTASAQTTPLPTTPVQKKLTQAASIQAASTQAAPVKAAPIQAAPVQAVPVQVASVQMASTQAAPIQAAPSQPTSLQHGGEDRNNTANQAQRPQFSEFVPGRSNHHAVLQAAPQAPQHNSASQQPGLGSSRWAAPTTEISMQPSAANSLNGSQNAGGSVFGSMLSNATAGSSNQPQAFPANTKNLFMSSQASQSSTPAARPARKPKQGLASSLWASR